MLIGLIKQGNASREFNGYLDKEASKKKTIENVFVKGDKAFLTGEFFCFICNLHLKNRMMSIKVEQMSALIIVVK